MSPLGTFITRERFGKPQFIAAGILLIFLAQCLWLMSRGTEMDSSEMLRLQEGFRQWHGQGIAGTASGSLIYSTTHPEGVEENDGYDANHSPLWYLLGSLPLLGWPGSWPATSMSLLGWLIRIPYLLFGLLLGASLWYVSRRLYGDEGGYIALTLYCFSPVIIRQSTLWHSEPEIGAAWGTFGAIFTAIAVAHTLYAPREVVLWNWRRILLLGLSLVLAIGCQFSLVILAPLALVLMLYVAHKRRRAATVIWLAACGVATLLLCAAYGFHPGALYQGVRHAELLGVNWRSLTMVHSYYETMATIVDGGPAVPVALAGALAVYFSWRRTRYFGNTLPLLIGALLLAMAVATPHYQGMGNRLMAMPFFFVFIAGAAADMLETPRGLLVSACVWGLLAADALWNLLQLAKAGRG